MPDPLDPQYRCDPVTGRWVIIAPVRASRPITLAHARPHHRAGNGHDRCPLCEGAEANTPDEVYAVREPGSPVNGRGWRVRIVPNKYPAVHPIGEPAFLTDGPHQLFNSMPGFGEHELLIECPDHRTSPTALTDGQFALVLTAYRERLAALAETRLYAYATVFKNVGAEAGASLAHSHSQILAMPVIPEAVRHEIATSAGYHGRTGRCVFCDLLRADAADPVRVVAETPNFIAACPFAPRFAYETWVLPRAHDSRYETLTDDRAGELAGLLRSVLGRLDAVLDGPAFNYYLHTSPLRSENLPHYHWHVEVIPRTTRQAGFEWGSGCFINAVAPEAAAAELREVSPQRARRATEKDQSQ